MMPAPNGYINPYDTRIGSGSLPSGIAGSENRAYTYTPQDNQTSFGLVNRYTQQGSPLLDNARRGAGEFASRRGLLNSSIAAGNAERAAIDTAGQFAQQDAGLISNAMLKNVDVLNAREAERAAEAMQNNMSSLVNSNAEAQRQSEAANRLQLQREALAFEGEQGQLGRIHQADIGRMNYGFDVGMENLSSGNQYRNQYRLNDQGYGQDLGRAQQQYGFARGLNEQANQFQSDRDYNDFRYGVVRDSLNNMFSEAEYLDPEFGQQFMAWASSIDPNGRPTYVNRNPYLRG